MHDKIKENRVEIDRKFNSRPKDGIKAIIDICEKHNEENPSNPIDPEKQIAEFFKVENYNLDFAKKFNSRPKEGIEAIKKICKEYNEENPSNTINPEKLIAEFFKAEKSNLDLEAVGEFLSDDKVENKQVLEHFVNGIDFKDKDFINGLRDYLKTFKLPGEGQRIDRLLDAFANKYIDDNPEFKYTTKYSIGTLAFGVIMLNTDLHNPSVKGIAN